MLKSETQEVAVDEAKGNSDTYMGIFEYNGETYQLLELSAVSSVESDGDASERHPLEEVLSAPLKERTE